MAKAPEPEIMSPAEMKPLLMLSKRQPVNCAIGLTKDKDGVILLDKKAKPRKLIAMIKSEAKSKGIILDIASLRFGRAEVDTEVNSSLVQFIVNKEVAGTLRPKLLESLKKAGFQKCEISVDMKLDDEPDEDEKPEAAVAAPAAARAPAADQPAAAAAPAAPEADAPAAAAPQAAAPGAPDAGAITKRVTELVKRMVAGMAAKPAGGDAMKTAASAAQKALQGGDVASAGKEADTLERLLDASDQAGAGAAAGGKAAGPAMGSPVIAKAGATWVATRKKVESEIEKLHDELQAVYKGQGVVADLEKTFRAKVEPMMSTLDHSLSDKLADMAKNADPAAHAKLVGEVTKIIESYKSFLSSDSLISKLDSNPFVPLAIEKTLTASLTALEKVLA